MHFINAHCIKLLMCVIRVGTHKGKERTTSFYQNMERTAAVIIDYVSSSHVSTECSARSYLCLRSSQDNNHGLCLDITTRIT